MAQSPASLVKLSPKVEKLLQVVRDFVDLECIPAQKIYHNQLGTGENRWKIVPPIIEELKARAKKLGLWNLWIPSYYPESPGLTNLEYAVLCEHLGRSLLASEATNCSAPDTGNMEVLARYGTPEQKALWLEPLMSGKIRSAFAMTEPNVASSDATNIETSIVRQGDSYIINGSKWWISGAGDPRCELYLVMGKTDAGNQQKHLQQSVILVPANTPGVRIVRPMQVFGYDDAPHGHMEMTFTNVCVPASNIILGPGRGFEVVQGRLGPGRIHHCMRAIGTAESALEQHILRVTDSRRKPFGKVIAQQGTTMSDIALSRAEINQARLLVLNAAARMDAEGPKAAMVDIAIAKAVVPMMAQRVIDRAIQSHGACGVSQDSPLAYAYSGNRTLRLADGPDEVHNLQIARAELRRAKQLLDRRHQQLDQEERLQCTYTKSKM